MIALPLTSVVPVPVATPLRVTVTPLTGAPVLATVKITSVGVFTVTVAGFADMVKGGVAVEVAVAVWVAVAVEVTVAVVVAVAVEVAVAVVVAVAVEVTVAVVVAVAVEVAVAVVAVAVEVAVAVVVAVAVEVAVAVVVAVAVEVAVAVVVAVAVEVAVAVGVAVAVDINAGIITAAYTMPESVNAEMIILTSLLVIIAPPSALFPQSKRLRIPFVYHSSKRLIWFLLLFKPQCIHRVHLRRRPCGRNA